MTTTPDPIVVALLAMKPYDSPVKPDIQDYQRVARIDEQDVPIEEIARRVGLMIHAYSLDVAGHAMFWGYND